MYFATYCLESASFISDFLIDEFRIGEVGQEHPRTHTGDEGGSCELGAMSQVNSAFGGDYGDSVDTSRWVMIYPPYVDSTRKECEVRVGTDAGERFGGVFVALTAGIVYAGAQDCQG